jgi:hypothetical protein
LGLAKGENPLYDPLFETIGEEEDGMNMVFGTQGISQVGSRGAFRTTLNAFRRAFRAETAATAWHPIGELQGKYGRHNILSPHDIKVHDTEERLRLWKAYVQPFAVNQIRPTLVSMTNALGAQARTARKSKSPVIDVPEQFGVRAGEVARAAAAGLIESADYDAFLAAYAEYRSARELFGVAEAAQGPTSAADSWDTQIGAMTSAVTFVDCGLGLPRGVANKFDETALRGGLLPEIGDGSMPCEDALKGMELLRQAVEEGQLTSIQRFYARSVIKGLNPQLTRMMGKLDAEGQAWFISKFVASLMADGNDETTFHLISFAEDMGNVAQV